MKTLLDWKICVGRQCLGLKCVPPSNDRLDMQVSNPPEPLYLHKGISLTSNGLLHDQESHYKIISDTVRRSYKAVPR